MILTGDLMAARARIAIRPRTQIPVRIRGAPELPGSRVVQLSAAVRGKSTIVKAHATSGRTRADRASFRIDPTRNEQLDKRTKPRADLKILLAFPSEVRDLRT